MPKFYPFSVQALFAKLTTLRINEGKSAWKPQEAAFSAIDLTQYIFDTKRFQIAVTLKIHLQETGCFYLNGLLP